MRSKNQSNLSKLLQLKDAAEIVTGSLLVVLRIGGAAQEKKTAAATTAAAGAAPAKKGGNPIFGLFGAIFGLLPIPGIKKAKASFRDPLALELPLPFPLSP